jgi:hypothetical protein
MIRAVCEHCGSDILPPSNEESLTDKERKDIDQIRDRISSFISSQVEEFWPEHMDIHIVWQLILSSYDVEAFQKEYGGNTNE